MSKYKASNKQNEEKKEFGATIKNWIKDHLILIWVFCSVAFAFTVHCLFSKIAPCKWLEAKWSAGDILTYTSTVALGLLAVWQNKKFKEESDESQNRMEKLALKSNELSIISKIIEREDKRISRLNSLKLDFLDACKTEGISSDLSDVAIQPENFRKLYVKVKMDSRDKQISFCTIELLSELKTYPNDDNVIKLINLISNYSQCSRELIKNVKELKEGSVLEETYLKKKEVEKDIVMAFSDYIADQENTLKKVIYGDLSLNRINELYYQNRE